MSSISSTAGAKGTSSTTAPGAHALGASGSLAKVPVPHSGGKTARLHSGHFPYSRSISHLVSPAHFQPLLIPFPLQAGSTVRTPRPIRPLDPFRTRTHIRRVRQHLRSKLILPPIHFCLDLSKGRPRMMLPPFRRPFALLLPTLFLYILHGASLLAFSPSYPFSEKMIHTQKRSRSSCFKSRFSL